MNRASKSFVYARKIFHYFNNTICPYSLRQSNFDTIIKQAKIISRACNMLTLHKEFIKICVAGTASTTVNYLIF